MAKQYDLVVVGGGPAGLMAAGVAAGNGLKTALFERKKTITKITRVDGGILGPMNEYTFGQTTVYNPGAKKIGFPVCGFSVPYDGPARDIYGFNIFSPGGKMIVFGDRRKQKQDPSKNRVGVVLDKALMLKGLLDEARKNGADIFPGVNVTGIETGAHKVAVTGNGQRYEADFVIAADGVNSRIAMITGMNRERKFIATHPECAWCIEGIEIPDIEGIGFIFTSYGTFYVTSCCREQQYHVGIVAFKPSDDLPAALHRFVHDDPVYSRWFKGGKKTGEMSCVLNMLSPMTLPFKDNILFIGDAAWLMEVTNAVAICCGWKAANSVTLAMLNGNINQEGLTDYFEWWDKYFLEPHGDVDFKPFELSEFLTDEDIDYLAGLVKHPLAATMDFYKLTGTLGSTFAELFPVIQENNPELMGRMMAMANSMDELEAAAVKAGFPNR